MSDETTSLNLVRDVIAQTRGRAMWLQQHVPIEAILPARRESRDARGADQDDAPKARADNFKTTGGYGYETGKDGIAMFAITGMLVPLEYADYFYSNEITVTDLLSRDVVDAMNNPDVKGAMFFNNSPGGFVTGAYELAESIAALSAAKPTATFGKSIVASAAYLQASMTGRITAYKTAEVGSIGTRSAVYDMHRMAERIGLEVIPIDSGGMKSAGLPGTQITKEQVAYWQGLLNKLNAFFTDAVAKARGFSAEKMKSLADGRVHVAADAKAAGLIDAVGSMPDAMKELQSRVARKQTSTGRGMTFGTYAALLDAAQAHSAGAISQISSTTVVEVRDGKVASVTQSMTPEAAIQSFIKEQIEINTAEEPSRESVDASASAPGAELQAAASNEENQMADSTKTAAAGNPPPAPQTVQNEPKPATIAELKAAFPKDSAFALDAAEKAYTLVEAKAAYSDVLATRNEELAAKNAELATAATQQPAPRKPGVAPIESAGARNPRAGAGASAGGAGGDAIAEFNDAVAEQMAKPGFDNRRKAIAHVQRAQPDLHQAYLNANNPGMQQRQQIAERFA